MSELSKLFAEGQRIHELDDGDLHELKELVDGTIAARRGAMPWRAYNTLEISRIQEIVEQLALPLGQTKIGVERDNDGILIVEVPYAIAQEALINPFLWVDAMGRVASADLSHPTYYKTMQDLLEDAASRKD